LNHFIIPRANKVRLDFEEKYYRDAILVEDYHADYPGNQTVYFSNYSNNAEEINDLTVQKWNDSNQPVYFLKARSAYNKPGTFEWTLKDYYEKKITALKEKEKEIQLLLAEKDKQIAKLEEIIKNKDKSIMDIAFAKTARSLPITNNTTNNNNNITVNYTINLNDIDRLNQVIERHMTQSVIRGGIPSFTRMLYKNYLTSPEGELGYKCTDIARQKFELIDENGNRREDVRADELREALEKSNLEEKTKRTAKEAWTKADGTCNKDIFNQLVVKAQEITAITEQEGDCNAKFRSELAVQASKYIK
jgi:hypothetical protein